MQDEFAQTGKSGAWSASRPRTIGAGMAAVAVMVCAMFALPARAVTAISPTTWQTVVHLETPVENAYDIVRIEYFWSTYETTGEVTADELVHLEERYYDSHLVLVYQSESVVGGVAQPLGGLARSLSDLAFRFDLDSRTLLDFGWDYFPNASGTHHNFLPLILGGHGLWTKVNGVNDFADELILDVSSNEFLVSNVSLATTGEALITPRDWHAECFEVDAISMLETVYPGLTVSARIDAPTPAQLIVEIRSDSPSGALLRSLVQPSNLRREFAVVPPLETVPGEKYCLVLGGTGSNPAAALATFLFVNSNPDSFPLFALTERWVSANADGARTWNQQFGGHFKLQMGGVQAYRDVVGYEGRRTLIETGFEDPPFVEGSISGQSGWYGGPWSEVQSETVRSGAQALRVDPPDSGYSDVGPLVSYDSLNDPHSIVRIHSSVRFAGTGTPAHFGVFALSGSEFIGQLIVGSDDALAIGAGVGRFALTRSIWYPITFEVNFESRTTRAYLNGYLVSRGAIESASTNLTGVRMGAFPNSVETFSGFYDNLVIETVPEPAATIGALVSLFVLGCMRCGRRRAARGCDP